MRLTYGHEPTPPVVAAMGDHLAITIHISHEDAAAIGPESGRLTEWYLSALRTLAALRTGEVDRETEAGGIARGPATIDTWYWTINDLDDRLMPRLDGIRNTAIRAHHAYGGSLANLATAMGTARSTAQSRRERLIEAPLSLDEEWACNGRVPRTSPPPAASIADLERDLIAAKGDPQRHAEIRARIRAAGFASLADELDRIAASDPQS